MGSRVNRGSMPSLFWDSAMRPNNLVEKPQKKVGAGNAQWQTK